MRQIDDYIPIELWHESKNFLEEINCDIEIYEKFKTFEKDLNEEALKFEAWWNWAKSPQKQSPPPTPPCHLVCGGFKSPSNENSQVCHCFLFLSSFSS